MNKTCLVVRLSALGDCVLTTGALRYWHKQHGMNFCVVTRAAFAPVFENNPAVSRIFALEKEDLKTGSWLRFCLKLRKEMRYVPLLDLHGNLRTRLLRLLWLSACHCYPKMELQRRFFQYFKPVFLEKKLTKYNVPQRYSLTLTSPPPEPALVRPKIYLTDEEKKWAADLLLKLDIHQPPVIFHPYAKHDTKTWPLEKWRQLTKALEENGHEWLVIGQNPTRILPNSRRDLTNHTNLRETCALITQAKTFISADSGPMHLATALETPVVALFGPTTKHWGFFPSGENDLVLEKNIPCRPCSLHGKKDCPYNQRCLQQISITDVLKAILPFA